MSVSLALLSAMSVTRLGLLLVIFLFSTNVKSVINTPGRVIVTTALGRVIGTVESIGPEDGNFVPNGGKVKHFYAFRGIPYAKPPVAGLRWKDPLPFGAWMSDLDGTNFGSVCPQNDRITGNVMGDENCLFLNIYAPNDSILGRSDESDARFADNQRALLPVMVWFHGGGYIRGGSSQFGPQFLMREGHGVILVTVNYRLGIFGFLSTGDRNLPGNYAMLDQIESLRWVKNHIANFGGDPERVTIFGESAGGSITHLLTLSPLTQGLFSQAIIQSASGLCDWSIELDPLDYTRAIATQAGCPEYPMDAMLSCLKTMSTETLIRLQTDQFLYSLFPIRLAPVIDVGSRDDPFLPELPLDIIRNRRYKPVPMMTGLTAGEGLLFYLWVHSENMAKMSNRQFIEQELFPGLVAAMIKNSSQLDAVVGAVRQQYLGDTDLGNAKTFVPRFSQMIEDAIFTSCVYTAQQMTAKTSTAPVYAYLFSYRGQQAPSYAAAFADALRRSGFDHPLMSTGVTHGDDLLYLFRMAGFNAVYSPQDLAVSTVMTTLWTNFAKTGDPVKGIVNPAGISFWPPVSSTADTITYLNIDAHDTHLRSDFRRAETNFWMNVVPHIRQMATVSQQQNNYSLSSMWTMVGLLVMAIALVVFLVFALLFKQRRRDYPVRGAVVERAPVT